MSRLVPLSVGEIESTHLLSVVLKVSHFKKYLNFVADYIILICKIRLGLPIK